MNNTVIFMGAELRAVFTVKEVESLSQLYEIYIADGKLVFEERG